MPLVTIQLTEQDCRRIQETHPSHYQRRPIESWEITTNIETGTHGTLTYRANNGDITPSNAIHTIYNGREEFMDDGISFTSIKKQLTKQQSIKRKKYGKIKDDDYADIISKAIC